MPIMKREAVLRKNRVEREDQGLSVLKIEERMEPLEATMRRERRQQQGRRKRGMA